MTQQAQPSQFARVGTATNADREVRNANARNQRRGNDHQPATVPKQHAAQHLRLPLRHPPLQTSMKILTQGQHGRDASSVRIFEGLRSPAHAGEALQALCCSVEHRLRGVCAPALCAPGPQSPSTPLQVVATAVARRLRRLCSPWMTRQARAPPPSPQVRRQPTASFRSRGGSSPRCPAAHDHKNPDRSKTTFHPTLGHDFRSRLLPLLSVRSSFE